MSTKYWIEIILITRSNWNPTFNNCYGKKYLIFFNIQILKSGKVVKTKALKISIEHMKTSIVTKVGKSHYSQPKTAN